MGDVIDLPSRAQQGMEFLETEIRKLMAARGESEAATEIALQTLKDVYSRYGEVGKHSFQIKLPPDLSEHQIQNIHAQVLAGIQLLTEEHSHIINRLAAELVMTKVKLFELETKPDE